jgi:putative hydrolase of the HAD superfamily
MAIKFTARGETREIDGIVWDLDNTLYRFDDALVESFHIAMAKAALDSGLVMDLQTAIGIARRSYIERGMSSKIFTEDYGVPFAAIHHSFHHHISEKMIAANEETREAFAQLDVKHAIITHASKEWALRVLAHLGLSGWFSLERVFGLESVNFKRKDDSREPFTAALGAMDVVPERAMMVDDLIPNLRIPHEMGLTTVFLHHGRVPETTPDFVDASLSSTLGLLKVCMPTNLS